MARQVGTLPLQVKRVPGAITQCEACAIRMAEWRITLNPPGSASVTHNLCERCAGDHPKQ